MRENKGLSQKLAVFDLDGTLYKCNSHIELLNQRYRARIFDSIFLKAFGKVYSRGYMKLLHYFYNRVPIGYIKKFNPEFRESALEFLKEKKREGYCVVIVSNAPKELIEVAAKRLKLKWLRAEIGQKNKVVLENYSFDKLFVCTDNLSDIDLLDIAHERVIYATKRNISVFSDRYPNATILLEV
ncbi:HAD family hydrolase [Paenibacillus contaminans]|nr:HAD family hydrolase [Paenibacillus contaminans]